MSKLCEVARYIRSKNAGPFWLTIDIFFDTAQALARVKDSSAISCESVAKLYGVNPATVKIFYIDNLCVIKISFPRFAPQGSAGERDMHGGQQYALLADIEIP